MLFFDERTPQEELMEVIRMDKAIEKAQSRMDEVTQDRDFMREYTRRMKATCDWTTSINTALEKGMAQGLAQGLEQGMERLFETARRMTARGVAAEDIAAFTGLSAEQIALL